MSSDEKKTEVCLAQWQTCVEMANAISQRRDATNNVFVTLNLAIITAASFVWELKSIFLLIAGIGSCFLWFRVIGNFKALNTEKFHVINAMEEFLPFQPFTDEWEHLRQNPQYKDATFWEKFLPGVFITVYIVAISILTIKYFCGGA